MADTILLVKDSDSERMLIERAMERARVNARLHVARDGQEAVDYLKGASPFGDRERYPFPKLMLLDLKMPRLDGFQVLDITRNNLGCKLPIIVLTNSENPADIKRAYELGATSYFQRPRDMAGLNELILVLHAYWLKFNHFPD